MDEIRWTIKERLAPDQATTSVRSLLHDQWLLPDRYIHFLRRRQNVLVNREYRYMNETVTGGDDITMLFNGDEFRTPGANHYVPTADPKITVLYENRDLLVINKPRGQKSHPNEDCETGTVMNDVAGYLGGECFMVHRLDQETSGAMVVAKNPVVVPILNRLISSGKIHREYVAVVKGQLTGEGIFAGPIGGDPVNKCKYKVDGINAKPARTRYHILASNADRSFVRLQLETGRTHQIRVHLADSGHPIVGDPLYGDGDEQGMLLHGIEQRLVLPFSFKNIQIQAPLPPYFLDYLVKYRL
ncbi:MAG: RluA family pseudouridine synthase [Limosilactobacillus sp.]|uniref:RluA family pseudouridine synthase n=1 Tax=Limosilactobacillus sp. TaxID=2773925 RepID=UPI0026FED2C5|nr:RluA family pseudouridine synthase [Limosilactobacillus sp.]